MVQVCRGGEPPLFYSLGNTNNSADCREGCQRNLARVCGGLLVRTDAWGATLRGTLSKRSLERERRTSGGSTASCISSRTPPPTPMTPPKKSPTCAAAAPSIQQNSVVRACINPHHTVATDHATNLSHNQCANGCAQLCPHSKNAHGQMWRDGG